MSRVTELVDRMRAAAGVGEPGSAPDREQVKTLAAQFESMLLVQMLRDMRQAGKWDDEAPEGGGLGAETFFETLDVELAGYLSRAKGLGLAEQLEAAINKTAGAAPRKEAPTAAVAGPPGPVGMLGTQPAPATAAGTTGVKREADLSHSVTGPIEGQVRFAVAPGSITSSYGWRRDPFTGQARFHRGIDVRASYGQEVQSAGAGRVVFSGEQRGYGTTVVVEHGDGVQTRYAHLSATVVQEGQTVTPGQVVGRAGRSGRATGTHLHFEVMKDGRHVSPTAVGFPTLPGAAGAAD